MSPGCRQACHSLADQLCPCVPATPSSYQHEMAALSCKHATQSWGPCLQVSMNVVFEA